MPPKKATNKKPNKRYTHPDNNQYYKNLSARLREDYNDNMIANKRVFQNEIRQANLYQYASPNPKITTSDPKIMYPLYEEGNLFIFTLEELLNQIEQLGPYDDMNELISFRNLYHVFAKFKAIAMSYFNNPNTRLTPDVATFFDKIVNTFVLFDNQLAMPNYVYPLDGFDVKNISQIRNFLQTMQNNVNKYEMLQNNNGLAMPGGGGGPGGGGPGGGGGGGDDDDDDDSGYPFDDTLGGNPEDDTLGGNPDSYFMDPDASSSLPESSMQNRMFRDTIGADNYEIMSPIMRPSTELQRRDILMSDDDMQELGSRVSHERSRRQRLEEFMKEQEAMDELRQDNKAGSFGEFYNQDETFDDPFMPFADDKSEVRQLDEEAIQGADDRYTDIVNDNNVGRPDTPFHDLGEEEEEYIDDEDDEGFWVNPLRSEDMEYDERVARETAEAQGHPDHTEGDNAVVMKEKASRGRPPKEGRVEGDPYPKGPNQKVLKAIDNQYQLLMNGDPRLSKPYENLQMEFLYNKLDPEYKQKVDGIELHKRNKEDNERRINETPRDVINAIKAQHRKMQRGDYGLNPNFKNHYDDKYYDTLPREQQKQVDEIHQFRKDAQNAPPQTSRRTKK